MGPVSLFCSPRFRIKLPNTKKGALSIPRLLGILVRVLLPKPGFRVEGPYEPFFWSLTRHLMGSSLN